MKLEHLPQEIIFQISNHLNQNELLNLLCTNSSFYNSLHSRLYMAVNIDSSKRVFTDFKVDDLNYSLVPNYYDNCITKIKPVIISSLYSLNLFFKNLIQNPSYCSYVRVLIFNYEIPDIPDLELYKVLTIITGNLNHLKVFQWLNFQYNLSTKFISDLMLIELRGNFHLEKGSTLSFQHLKSLELSNSNLQPLDFNNFPKLKELTISKLPSSSKSNVHGDGYHNYWDTKELKSHILEVFNHPNQVKTKLGLSKLTLKHMVLCGEDVEVLNKSIDLSHLTSLSIVNCFESLYDQDEMYDVRRRRIKAKFFLQELGVQVNKQLENLEIYMMNELNYNNKLVNFLTIFKHLKSLELNININEFENLTLNLISILKSISKSVERLHFDYNLIGKENHVKTKNQFRPDSKMLLMINKFPQLKYLHIPYQIDDNLSLDKLTTKNLQALSLRIRQDSFTKKIVPTFNCLINSGYFALPSLSVDQFHTDGDCIDEYQERVNQLKQHLEPIKWIQLEFNDNSMIFQCLNDSNNRHPSHNKSDMVHRQGLQSYFHNIIENHIV